MSIIKNYSDLPSQKELLIGQVISLKHICDHIIDVEVFSEIKQFLYFPKLNKLQLPFSYENWKYEVYFLTNSVKVICITNGEEETLKNVTVEIAIGGN